MGTLQADKDVFYNYYTLKKKYVSIRLRSQRATYSRSGKTAHARESSVSLVSSVSSLTSLSSVSLSSSRTLGRDNSISAYFVLQ